MSNFKVTCRAAGLVFVFGGMLAACWGSAPTPVTPTAQLRDLSSFFEGYEACFVLWNTAADEYVYYNPERCAERLSPCSTFKIPHSLIALETGVVPDENYVIAWDGTHYPIESWNRDHTLASAVQNSVVWYFQAVAAEIGQERMQRYLDLFDYGNKDISGSPGPFWLGSSLEISADEQIDFLHRLDTGTLPVSPRSMDIVKEIIVLEETGGYVYRGKTGACSPPGKQPWGWLVGTVSRDGTTVIFATNIQGPGANGQEARNIAEDVLEYLDVLK
jgi:beta-lactamase class D